MNPPADGIDARELVEADCLRFVEEQSCGEWSDADIAIDAAKLAAFVNPRLEAQSATIEKMREELDGAVEAAAVIFERDEATIAGLREALRPFARWGERGPSREYIKDGETYPANTPHTAPEYRAAIAALATRGRVSDEA